MGCAHVQSGREKSDSMSSDNPKSPDPKNGVTQREVPSAAISAEVRKLFADQASRGQESRILVPGH